MSESAKNESNYPLSVFFRDLWQHTVGFHRRLILWFIIRGFSSFLGLLPPLILAKLVNSLADHTFTFSEAVFYVSLYLVAGLLQVYLRLKGKFYIGALSDKVRLKIRQDSISKFINFDLDWHEQENSGKKVTVITKGADSVRELIRFLSGSGGGLDILVNISGVMIYLLINRPTYFFIALLNAILYVYVNQKVNQSLIEKWHDLNKENEKVVGKNYDYFSNIGLIKRLGIGQQINRTLFKKELQYTQKSINTNRININKWISIQSISQIFQALAIILIIIDVHSGRVLIGDFFIITGYLDRLQGSLGDIATCVDDVIDNKLGFLRLIQLTFTGRTQTDIGHLISPLSPNIYCQNVSFSYPNHDISILKNLNLEILSGQKVGLVGESGSGKSTFTKLLLRLYLLSDGSISFNDTNINEISTRSLRHQFAIAPQDSEVFNLTFKENITIASDKIKFNSRLYKKAIDIADCQPILDKIKNNHQVMLGEKGVKLSGGERQRLGIARAIYKNAPVMIFDESTSSLDSRTEEKILTNIEKHLQNKTIFWIAHRLSTLRFTDRIIVFDQGKIVEDGTFCELTHQHGLFYQLWQIQKRTKLNSES